jgi:hypothetical protein
MIAATTIGIFIIPALYFLFQRMGEKLQERRERGSREQEAKENSELEAQ